MQSQSVVVALIEQHGCKFLCGFFLEALSHFGKPEIFNSDQGSQFTSDVFTDALKENGVTITMDGRGRALDNIFVERLWRTVTYESVYLKKIRKLAQFTAGTDRIFYDYNGARPHQSLRYDTLSTVYKTAGGGGAKIMDKFGDGDKQSSAEYMGQRRSAVALAEAT